MRFAYLLRSIVLAGVVAAAACGGKGKSRGTGGTGGDAGSGGPEGTGGGGGTAGAGGGTAGASGGAGGGNGGTGGMTITGCPPSMPTAPLGCTGSFTCRYTAFCNCHGCCSSGWRCMDGTFQASGLDFDDGCLQGLPCPDGGAGTFGTQGTGGAAGTGGAVCTFGADHTCNDSPLISSEHGRCTDAGVCECTFGAGLNPDSGRCL